MAFNRRLRVMLIAVVAILTIFRLNGAANGIDQNKFIFDRLGIWILSDGSIVSQFEIVPFTIDPSWITEPPGEARCPWPAESSQLLPAQFIIGVPLEGEKYAAGGDVSRFGLQFSRDRINGRGYQFAVRPEVAGCVDSTATPAAPKIAGIDEHVLVSQIYGQAVPEPIQAVKRAPVSPAWFRINTIRGTRWRGAVPGAVPNERTPSIAHGSLIEPTTKSDPKEKISNEHPAIDTSIPSTAGDAASATVPTSNAGDATPSPEPITADDKIMITEPISAKKADTTVLPEGSNINNDVGNSSQTILDSISLIRLVAAENAKANASPTISPSIGRQGKTNCHASIGNDLIKGTPGPNDSGLLSGSPFDPIPMPFVPPNSGWDKLIGNTVQSTERGKVHNQTQRKLAEISLALKPLTHTFTAVKIGGTNDSFGLTNQPRAPANGQRHA